MTTESLDEMANRLLTGNRVLVRLAMPGDVIWSMVQMCRAEARPGGSG
jgi:hypothetical protein